MHRGTLYDFILQKTLSPCPPPKLPERPLRYPIVCTRKLIDLSDAPLPPPRTIQPPTTNFISNITKDADVPTDFHTSAIQFADNDKAKLKLTLSSNQRKYNQNDSCNGSTPRPTVPERPRPAYKTRQEVILICVTIVFAMLYIYLRDIFIHWN